MDCMKTGEIIKNLRKEKNMTQKDVADRMNISDKTVSKWERGLGCPDVSLLSELSEILGVNISDMLSGELSLNTFVGGNMKKSKYYVCPVCGNVTMCTGNAQVSCCGRTLAPLEMKKAQDNEKLLVQQIEDDWFITGDYPMEKDNYISFVAFATGDCVQIMKQYPEWEMQVRIPKRKHGMLLWYSTTKGLFYMYL